MESDPYLVKFFIEAKRKEDLPGLQLKNNILNSKRFMYGDAVLQDGMYVMYYYRKADDVMIMESVFNKIKEGK